MTWQSGHRTLALGVVVPADAADGTGFVETDEVSMITAQGEPAP